MTSSLYRSSSKWYDSCGQGRNGSRERWMFALKKKKAFSFFIIIILIWKYAMPNINLIFEYSIIDKIRFDWKMYRPPPTTCCPPSKHTPTYTFIISLPQKQQLLSKFIDQLCNRSWYLFYSPLLYAIHDLELALFWNLVIHLLYNSSKFSKSTA